MKKIIILVLIVLFMASGLVFGDNLRAEKQTPRETSSDEIVTKTYFLKHVDSAIIEQTLRPYYVRSSYVRGSNVFTVKILKSNVAKFEELLKKLDVRKKEILIRIFSVIASKEGKTGDIENKELKLVLAKLQKVLNFKAFRLDGVSALTVKDGQRRGRIQLSSSSNLLLELEHIYIKKETSGQRCVGFEFTLDQFTRIADAKDGNNVYSERLIESETSVKENGFLVAGVSKIGKNGDSLVLIINAEIK
jgi:hypothetical protein